MLMFLDQRRTNSLMRELDYIERVLTLTDIVRPEHVREVQERLNYIRELLTDQPLAPTATPE